MGGPGSLIIYCGVTCVVEKPSYFPSRYCCANEYLELRLSRVDFVNQLVQPCFELQNTAQLDQEPEVMSSLLGDPRALIGSRVSPVAVRTCGWFPVLCPPHLLLHVRILFLSQVLIPPHS